MNEEQKQDQCANVPKNNLEFGLQKLADLSITLAKSKIGQIVLSFSIMFLFVSIAFCITTWVIAYNADNIIKIVEAVKNK